MIAGSGPVAPPPHPRVGSPWFLVKLMISVSIPCYGASSETISSRGAPERDSSLALMAFPWEPYSRESPSSQKILMLAK